MMNDDYDDEDGGDENDDVNVRRVMEEDDYDEGFGSFVITENNYNYDIQVREILLIKQFVIEHCHATELQKRSIFGNEN